MALENAAAPPVPVPDATQGTSGAIRCWALAVNGDTARAQSGLEQAAAALNALARPDAAEAAVEADGAALYGTLAQPFLA